MAGERIQLGVKARESAGSAESRRLRASGMIPGVLYGSGKKAHPFVVEERELRRVLTGDHGLHAILYVVFEGQKTAHHAVLKDYQLDPVRPRLLHVDLHELRLDQMIQAQVALEPIGESGDVASSSSIAAPPAGMKCARTRCEATSSTGSSVRPSPSRQKPSAASMSVTAMPTWSMRMAHV